VKVANDVEQLGCKVDSMSVVFDHRLDNLEDSVHLSRDVEVAGPKPLKRRMVQPFDFLWLNAWQQDRLKCRDANVSKQMHRVRGEISTAASNVRADHGHKCVRCLERLEQMGRCKLGVIRYGIGPTYFEFNPNPTRCVCARQANVCTSAVTEKLFESRRQYLHFMLAGPTFWTTLNEGLLQKIGKSAHRSHLFCLRITK
jgi:hypothetical protein